MDSLHDLSPLTSYPIAIWPTPPVREGESVKEREQEKKEAESKTDE